MDTGACPPTDVWDDLPDLFLDSTEEDALAAELRDHLKVCPHCRELCPPQQLRQSQSSYQRARRYANVATVLFGLVGISLVLTICFRTPVPGSTPNGPQIVESPAPTSTTTVLTQVEPRLSSFAGD